MSATLAPMQGINPWQAANDFCDEHTVSRDLCGCKAPAPTGLHSRLLNRASLATLPEPQPLIDRTLDRRTVALLAGYWGTGKSFLALDWAACVATGRPWQGRTTEQGRVLYVAAEGAYGLHQRLSAWEYAWGIPIPSDSLMVLPTPVNLGNRASVHELRSMVVDLAPDLVVLDTLARCAVGLDENSAKDMGMVIDSLYRLRDDADGGTVLAVHHTGKDRSTVRGSSAVEAGVDTVYQIEGDAGLLKLSRTKRKDGPTPDVHQFRLEPVTGMESVVIVSTRGVDMRPTAHELLSTFMSTFSVTGASKAELRIVAAMPPASFSRAINSLIDEGHLLNVGSDQRPFYRLAQSDD